MHPLIYIIYLLEILYKSGSGRKKLELLIIKKYLICKGKKLQNNLTQTCVTQLCVTHTCVLQINVVSLQRDETLPSTPTAVAMAQKRIRLCADILQQPSAGMEFLSAYVHRVYIVLPNLEFHLLF